MVQPVSHHAASYALKVQVFWYIKQCHSIKITANYECKPIDMASYSTKLNLHQHLCEIFKPRKVTWQRELKASCVLELMN